MFLDLLCMTDCRFAKKLEAGTACSALSVSKLHQLEEKKFQLFLQ